MPLPAIFSLKLDAWRVSNIEHNDPGESTLLSHTFWLDPFDICVGYKLVIEKVVSGASLYINDQHICEIETDHPVTVDVTDAVWLENNTIVIEVANAVQNVNAAFGSIHLEAIPCE